MKYKLIGIAAIAAMIIAVCFLNEMTGDVPTQRYHQHLEEPGYSPCTDHGDDVFCTHLPIVVIDTENQDIPGQTTEYSDMFDENLHTKAPDGTDYINVSVKVIDNDEGNNHLDDEADFTTRSLFRVRGHSSRKFEKSPYLMKFVNDRGEDRDIEVMGMDAHHEWALNGPYLDKSLVRNYLWYNISGDIMDDYVPNVRYCELFLNGDYRGVYLMTETITSGNNCRLKLKTSSKGENFTGYLVRVDRPVEAELGSARDINVFTERVKISREDMAIRYPGKSSLTPELAKEIELDVSAFEKTLYSYDHDTENYGFRNWIDVDNFIDYYLINEFTCNVDMGSYSTYLYKRPGEKYRMCVWDFNNSCNNYTQESHGRYGFIAVESGYYSMLAKDEEFEHKVIKRYRELRKNYLSDEYIVNYINDTLNWLGPAVERNYRRWKSAYETDMLDTTEENIYVNRNQYTPKEAQEFLCNWVIERGSWLDDNIDVLNHYCHPSRNKDWDH